MMEKFPVEKVSIRNIIDLLFTISLLVITLTLVPKHLLNFGLCEQLSDVVELTN